MMSAVFRNISGMDYFYVMGGEMSCNTCIWPGMGSKTLYDTGTVLFRGLWTGTCSRTWSDNLPDRFNRNCHRIKPIKVEYTSGGNFTKAASLPEKMCCGNAIVIGKGSEQTIYLSGGLRLVDDQFVDMDNLWTLQHGDDAWTVAGKLKCARSFHGSITFRGILDGTTSFVGEDDFILIGGTKNRSCNGEHISLRADKKSLNVINIDRLTKRSAVLSTYQTHEEDQIPPEHDNDSAIVIQSCTLILFLAVFEL